MCGENQMHRGIGFRKLCEAFVCLRDHRADEVGMVVVNTNLVELDVILAELEKLKGIRDIFTVLPAT